LFLTKKMSGSFVDYVLGRGSPYSRIGLIIQGGILVAVAAMGIYLYNSCQAYTQPIQERAKNVRGVLIVTLIAGLAEIFLGAAPIVANLVRPAQVTPTTSSAIKTQ
jgi:hypothetical protein